MGTAALFEAILCNFQIDTEHKAIKHFNNLKWKAIKSTIKLSNNYVNNSLVRCWVSHKQEILEGFMSFAGILICSWSDLMVYFMVLSSLVRSNVIVISHILVTYLQEESNLYCHLCYNLKTTGILSLHNNTREKMTIFNASIFCRGHKDSYWCTKNSNTHVG